MKVNILTIFPDMFAPLRQSMLGRAIDNGILEISVTDIRDYTLDKHNRVDDTPYGGGAGMVMRCQPVLDALRSVRGSAESGSAVSSRSTIVAALSPAGRQFTQKQAHRLSELDHLILICGHYEGMDERIYRHVDEEISIGDYVLTGGEIAAMAVSDAVIRLLPGALRSESTSEESFENGLLEYPQYTQPAVCEGEAVPEVLLSGNHARIRRWRLKESLRRTMERRPDLLEGRQFTEEEITLLEEIKKDAL